MTGYPDTETGLPPGYPTYPTIAPKPYRPAQGVALIVVVTFLLGPLGILPTAVRAGRAQTYGHPTHKYWVAFHVTLTVSVALAVLFLVLLPML